MFRSLKYCFTSQRLRAHVKAVSGLPQRNAEAWLYTTDRCQLFLEILSWRSDEMQSTIAPLCSYG